jgi:NADPH:quinone reductase-like Zn-dependent oxidoreductase
MSLRMEHHSPDGRTTMTAAVIANSGGEPTVSRASTPLRLSGEALIEVAAAAMNPVDLSIARGGYLPGVEPEFPLVPGQEGVGRVLEGETLEAGARVWFFTGRLFGPGSFAEQVSVNEAHTIPIPDALSDADAASLGVAAMTGWLSVQWRGLLEPGETVLVLGATGTVGAVAVQTALKLGAKRVVAAGRDEGALRHLGMREVVTVDLAIERSREELAKAFEEATDGGADLVIDPLWGDVGGAAVDAAPIGGRLVQLGQSAGAACELASIAVRSRMVSILGFTIWAVPHDVKMAAYRALATATLDGEFEVGHESVPLADIGDAWRRQAFSPHTKLILIP